LKFGNEHWKVTIVGLSYTEKSYCCKIAWITSPFETDEDTLQGR